MQATALSVFVKEFSPELRQATSGLLAEYGLRGFREWFTLTDEQRAEASARLEEIGYADVGDFIDHVDYAVDLIGIDHVGLSSDFDGGGGLLGWWDASETANVTLELVRRGYSREDIEKLWGGNLAARVAGGGTVRSDGASRASVGLSLQTAGAVDQTRIVTPEIYTIVAEHNPATRGTGATRAVRQQPATQVP